MNEPSMNKYLWIELRSFLTSLSTISDLGPLLESTGELEEMICLIFDDMQIIDRLEKLPDSLSLIKSFGASYFETVLYLIGEGPHIIGSAPIYDKFEQERLFTETAKFVKMIDQLLNESTET